MFAISFLQPLLLWGTALASVPLIIHILNKRRYRTVKWAAMEFLLRAFKENRRRIRLEQLLLLLLRMALVVILAMLLSRPQVSADDFGGLARRVVHHLLILDDSGSMGETSGIGSSFRVACQEVLKVSEALSKRRSGDLLTILRSSREKPDLLGRPVSSMLSSEVREVLRSARPGPDRLRLELCLERAKKIAEDVRQSAEVSSLHVYLLSDLKRVDLTGDQGRIADEILAKLRAFDAERSRFRVIRCGRSSPQNLALVALERKQPMSIAGQASTFEITVENQGTQSSFEVELGFTIDGGSRMTRRVPPLGPGEEHRQSFQADFQAAGSHWVEADLPKDRLDLDNRRSLAFPVAESSQILLIDGDPGESEELAETFYAAIAFDPDEDGSQGFRVSRVESYDLGQTDFQQFDFILLANLGTLDEESLGRLEAYVRSGGGLLMFSGDQVEPEVWNRVFWKDGEGLLPAPIGEVQGDMRRPESVLMADPGHPLFAGHSESFGKLLAFLLLGRYTALASATGGGGDQALPETCKVLLRVGKENGPPLLLEKPFGEGRVALCTTTADAAWHKWQSNPSYVLFLRLAAEYLMRSEDLSPRNIGARGSFIEDLPGAQYRVDARLLGASDEQTGIPERSFTATFPPEQPNMLRFRAGPLEGHAWPRAGCYKLLLGRVDGGEEPLHFTVSPWEEEGRLTALDKRDFMSGLPREIRERTEWIDQSSLAQAGFLADEGEVWRFLALALLVFLLLETLLAWRFGHH